MVYSLVNALEYEIEILRKMPGDEAYWVSFKFMRCG